jgi:hypothetical protein
MTGRRLKNCPRRNPATRVAERRAKHEDSRGKTKQNNGPPCGSR